MKFIEKHFDKLLLTFLFLWMGVFYWIFGAPDFIQLMRDLILMIGVLVGARTLPQPQSNTNVSADSVEVNQNQPKGEESQQPTVTITTGEENK